MSRSPAWPPTSASAFSSAPFRFRRHLRHRLENQPPQLPLLQRHLGEPRRHTWRTGYFSCVLACHDLRSSSLFPIVLVIWLFERGRASPERQSFRSGRPIRSAIQSENRRRGVAQPGSASALGAEGRGFESLRPDQRINDLEPNPDSPRSDCSEYWSGWQSFRAFQAREPAGCSGHAYSNTRSDEFRPEFVSEVNSPIS